MSPETPSRRDESSYLLEVAQDLACLGIFRVALGEQQSIFWSKECARIFGVAEDADPRTCFYEQVHQQDLPRLVEVVRRACERETFLEGELRIVRPDGEERWLHGKVRIERDQRGKALELLGVLHDITDHKRRLDALTRSEERYRHIASIVEWSSDAIVACDVTGTITSWNRGARRLYGYDESEVTGRSIDLLVPASLRDESLGLVERLLRGEAIERHITVRRCKDGSNVEVSLTISPVRDAARDIIGYSVIAHDLTDQRRAEGALRRAEQQLREAQKMEAVGLLAGGIAHDFNNMLSAIVGYTELVLDSLPPDDPIRGDILEVRKAGASAVGLTRQLLAFSRRQMLSPRVINLNQVVTHLERMVRRLFGPQVVLAFSLADDLGHVSADPSQVEQVIMNLVLNARDAMEDGGTLTLSTDNQLLEGTRAELLNLAPGRYVRLCVSDTGCGIDERTRARVFEPFFTTKEKGKGTGLGLSTALGIVQQSGGAVELESAAGQGTSFRVYLPCTDRPLQSAYSTPPARVSSRNWETILLVEDDEQVRALARTSLRRHGYQVLEAEHGQSALSICETHAGRIHLLLTDVIMPRMGGRELAERAAACRPEMKVIFMSGYASEEILPRDVVAGDTELLRKPVTPGMLVKRVREVLDQP